MTQRDPGSQTPHDAERRVGRGVLDPQWEEVLRRGRDEEAGDEVAGSVEPELEALHLLRHLREPEALDAGELDALWKDIAAATAPEKRPFWKATWFRWLVPVGAAAGIALVMVQATGDGAPSFARNDAEPSTASAPAAVEAKMAEAAAADLDAEADEAAAAPAGPAAVLEQQFKMLEPRARAEVGSSVDSQRSSMRAALIGRARGSAAPSADPVAGPEAKPTARPASSRPAVAAPPTETTTESSRSGGGR